MTNRPPFQCQSPPGAPILLVDDDRLSTDIRAEMMRAAGFDIEIAHSGAEALTKVAHHHFALFLLDYDMPGMNGIQLARELRGRGYGAPILMLSGRIDPPDEPGSELLSAFISKGESVDLLLKTLRDFGCKPDPIAGGFPQGQVAVVQSFEY